MTPSFQNDSELKNFETVSSPETLQNFEEKNFPPVSNEVKNRVESVTALDDKKIEQDTFLETGKNKEPIFPSVPNKNKKTNPLLKSYHSTASAESTTLQKISGGVLGGAVGAGSMLGLSTIMANAAIGTVTNHTIWGVTVAKTVSAGAPIYSTIGSIATFAIIPVAILGIVLGVKYLPKLFNKIKGWWKK